MPVASTVTPTPRVEVKVGCVGGTEGRDDTCGLFTELKKLVIKINLISFLLTKRVKYFNFDDCFSLTSLYLF